jgi:hypothetical protein
MSAAEPMRRVFEELALIEPIKLQVQTSEASAVDFEGFLAVSGERIAALDGAQLARLNQSGFLASAIFAASSLANMQRLLDRKQRRGSRPA